MPSREEELEHGSNAERLTKDPAFIKAFSDLEEAITNQWKECPLRDEEGAHQLKLMLKLLRDLRANLDQAIKDGNLVKVEIEKEKNPRPFLGRIK